MLKGGLRDRNSPTCTLSQNGYGIHERLHSVCGKSLRKDDAHKRRSVNNCYNASHVDVSRLVSSVVV